MKKIALFIVAAFLVASVSQAVTYTWGVTGIKDSGGSNMAKGSFIVYLYDADVMSVADATTAAAAGKLDTSKALFSSTGTGKGKALSDEISTTWSGDKTLFAVVFDNSTGNSGNYIVTDAVTETIPALGSATFGLTADKSWTPVGAPDPVPEPCSVALIALGLAAFGLKRKVA